MRFTYILLLLIVAIGGVAKELSPSVSIVQPEDKSRYVGEGSTFVIDTTFKEADTIVIKQDNNITTTLKVKPQKNTYCKTIELKAGVNIVSVSLYKDAKLVDKSDRELYFLSELFEGVMKRMQKIIN